MNDSTQLDNQVANPYLKPSNLLRGAKCALRAVRPEVWTGFGVVLAVITGAAVKSFIFGK